MLTWALRELVPITRESDVQMAPERTWLCCGFAWKNVARARPFKTRCISVSCLCLGRHGDDGTSELGLGARGANIMATALM